MKILYITHDYGHRWLKYAEFMRELGHEVDLIELKDKKTPNQVGVDMFSTQYDIIWNFAADYIWYKVLSEDFIKAIKEHRTTFIGYCTLNTVIPFKEWCENFKAFDLCFVHGKIVADMSQDQGLSNVIYVPYGFDKDEYFKQKIKKSINVSFMGSPQTNFSEEEDDRIKTLNALKDFKIKVYGGKFKGKLHRSIKVKDFSTHQEQNKVFNRSKINLNIGLINSQLPEFRGKCHPKNRFYEIPGSGNFMLSTYADEYQEQFQAGVHCAYYSSIEELCEKVEYYLTHENEREEMAETAYQHALTNHQTKYRFEQMMNIIEDQFF